MIFNASNKPGYLGATLRGVLSIGFVVFMWMMASCGKGDAPAAPAGGDTTLPSNPSDVSSYLVKARQTHDFILASYLTSYHSFRVNITTNTQSAFEWYNASQIYADAAMVMVGDTSCRPEMNETFVWMHHLWDEQDPGGGYFAFGNLDGSGASGTRYVDDNALTGVVYLAAYDVTTGGQKAGYLQAAEQCAAWVLHSGLWDTTFGGGFWWNTEKSVKPTQSNGLVLQLCLRLYGITGEAGYLQWADSINDWLNKRMYNSSDGLYIWQIEKGGKVDSQEFTYDNAIMAEADLLYDKYGQQAGYLAKAQALGHAMIRTLWNGAHNVFIFNTADLRINPTYCGWASQAMISLYEADHNVNWLSYAKGNIDAINTVLRDPEKHGYYQYAGLDGAGRYANMEGVDQAWMQRIQALLSVYK
jgi:uncharacterized protein YyaL (SSP411 family)